MWKQILSLPAGALLALLLLLAVAMAQAPTPDVRMHEGFVISSVAGRLLMTDTAGKEQGFTIDHSVKITVHGKPGKLEDLKPGFQINVFARGEDEVLAVSTVDVKKQPVR